MDGNNSRSIIENHTSLEQQAEVLAKSLSQRITLAVEEKGWASLAFSGGSTPFAMLRSLSNSSVDWSKVFVTLVDERCVNEDSDRSNAGMLRRALIDSLSTPPEFFPLFKSNESPAELLERFSDFPLPFDAVHLGMGEDAHTASFFPDAENINELVELDEEVKFQYTRSVSSTESRITLSLASLLNARYIVVQANGSAKKRVLNTVLERLRQLPEGANASVQDKAKLPLLAVLEHTTIRRPDGVLAEIYCVEGT
jgi:6-phosphogluconolactonase